MTTNSLSSATPHADATIPSQEPQIVVPEGQAQRDCCLVQIYPTNVVDGLQRLAGEELSIGRDEGNDLVLPDASVSRLHARLMRTPAGYVLEDLDSTNGTFVEQQRVTRRLLAGDETIRVGSFLFKFLRANCIEAHYHATVYAAMTRDGLTGAFNKSYLIDALEQELARSYRCARPLSLLIMDIDHFKKINDTWGHLVGDEVLKEFAKRLNETRRQDDLLCRYGGEEFVMILSDTKSADAIPLAERCRHAVAQEPFRTSDGEVPVTVSIGVAELDLDADRITSQNFLEIADTRLYRAKHAGRNQVCAQ